MEGKNRKGRKAEEGKEKKKPIEGTVAELLRLYFNAVIFIWIFWDCGCAAGSGSSLCAEILSMKIARKT